MLTSAQNAQAELAHIGYEAIRAESSCRRQPRVNTVGVCADEPPAGVPLNTAWDQLSAADRDSLAGHLGETIAALYQLPRPVIRDCWVFAAEGDS